MEALQAANPHINNPDVLYPGTALNIPVDQGSAFQQAGDLGSNLASREAMPAPAVMSGTTQDVALATGPIMTAPAPTPGAVAIENGINGLASGINQLEGAAHNAFYNGGECSVASFTSSTAKGAVAGAVGGLIIGSITGASAGGVGAVPGALSGALVDGAKGGIAGAVYQGFACYNQEATTGSSGDAYADLGAEMDYWSGMGNVTGIGPDGKPVVQPE